MNFSPNVDDMSAHLALLYDWTQTAYPNAVFEVRCIPPNGGGVRDKRFTCAPNGYKQAVDYAVQQNDNCNIYVTVNPLKPGTARTATDEDVEIALYHFADADGVDDPDALIAERGQGFVPTFTVRTGSTPLPRCQVFWQQSEPVTDMAAWRSTQDGLAQQFGTDATVKNPSRVLRLAGTVSYPPPRKQKRGYVVEATLLDRAGNRDVCAKSFAASFMPVEPPRAVPERTHGSLQQLPQPATDDGSCLPLCVIEAALEAIPPIMGPGQRNLWLDIAQACRDAHPGSFNLFDQWQSHSDRYDPKKDLKDWPIAKSPSIGSYKSLLAHAKRADPDWWRKHSGEVYDWGCLQAARLHALTQSVSGAAPTPPLSEGSNNRARFYRYRMSDMRQMTAPNWLIRDLLFQQQIAVCYAPPGSYKSFVAIALCSMLAHGMEWQGRKLKKPRVVYVAGEGFPMFRYRRQAWFKHNGIREQDDGFEVVKGAVNLTSTEDVLAFIEAMQAGDEVGLVVFDTLSTCIAGQNECDSAVMSLAVKNAKLIGTKLGCAVLIIHHPGKDVERGSRGHSSLLGDIDAEWRITRNSDSMACKLKVTKQKDGEYGQEFHFAATRVALGVYDEDGEEIFSLALSPVAKLGTEIPTYLADRVSIIGVIDVGMKTSTTRLAAKLMQNSRPSNCCDRADQCRSTLLSGCVVAKATRWSR